MSTLISSDLSWMRGVKLPVSVILLIFALSGIVLGVRASHRRSNLPPGPKSLPIIGNLLDMPSSEEWLTWQKYVDQYGDIVHLSALGRHYLLLGSYEVIVDLMEKRSHFNGRPYSTMLMELMNFGWFWPMLSYGDPWRRGRKMLHSQTHPNAAEVYRPHQMRGARRFVRDLLAAEPTRPLDKLSHAAKAILPHMIRYNFAYTALNIIYGIDVHDSTMGTRFVDPIEKTMLAFSEAARPGRFMVDSVPFLKYVPSWVPGAGFQRFGFMATEMGKQAIENPFRYMKANMASSVSTSAVMAAEMLKKNPNDEDLVKAVAGVAYGGGSDTTVSAVISYFLAMLSYPDVQKRAQEELDRVIGRQRFADFSDKTSLPYLEGVMRECLRWIPVVPVGTVHMTMQDDHYRGYFIPKGTVVLPLQWGLLHDEATYPNASVFSPERHLTQLSDGGWRLREDVPDPRAFAFGFGRRVCQGKHLAEQSLFAILTAVLQTLDVLRAKDHDGREVIPDVRVSNGMITHPLPFAYTLRARPDAKDLLDMCTIEGND